MKSRLCFGAALIACAALASPALAGTYASITLDGSYADWAGVPVLATDAVDGSPIDLGTIQIANDDSYYYVRLTYNAATVPNGGPSVYLSFDTDNNLTTGYDIYGLGQVGSDFSFVNDFPFRQTSASFNTFDSSFSSGALIAPYGVSTISQEIGIPRNLSFTTGPFAGQLVLGNSFRLMAWTDANPADATVGVSYAAALSPEPATLAAIAGGTVTLLRRRRIV